jgi:hypothetical protein
MTPSVTDDDIATALRGFLLAILPLGTEVIAGQSNRTPEPMASDYVVFTPLHEHRLSTNVDTYDAIDSVARVEPLQVSYQLDVHGPASMDNNRVIKLLWRSDYAVDTTDSAVLTPLYASDGTQRPFINGEGQYEDRWVLTVEAQVNPAVSTPMQFADTVGLSYFPGA